MGCCPSEIESQGLCSTENVYRSEVAESFTTHPVLLVNGHWHTETHGIIKNNATTKQAQHTTCGPGTSIVDMSAARMKH